MNIEWTVTIAVFLIFVLWSVNYYTSLFTIQSLPLDQTADIINDELIDYLTVDVYTVPIKFTSPEAKNGLVLFFNFTWPDKAKNSTRIYSEGTSLACNITGETLYWTADVTASANHFAMKFANQSVGLRCNSSSVNITHVNRTQVVPFVAEKTRLLSQDKINSMTNTSFSDFKNNLNINRDFRVQINISGSITTYGLNIPRIRNVFVREFLTRLEETDEQAEVSVAVW